MNKHPSTAVARWHTRERDKPIVERAKIAHFEFDYYLEDFDASCENLVSVVRCENPNDGVEPLIRVSRQIPENLRGYFALHEYIEFHAALLDGADLPKDCWEIERYVLTLFPDQRLANEYVERRLDMFEFIREKDMLTPTMVTAVEFLSQYVFIDSIAQEARAKSRRLRTDAQEALTDALELEGRLKRGEIVPRSIFTQQAEIERSRRKIAAAVLLGLGDSRVDHRDDVALRQLLPGPAGGYKVGDDVATLLLEAHMRREGSTDHDSDGE